MNHKFLNDVQAIYRQAERDGPTFHGQNSRHRVVPGIGGNAGAFL
jgi:hypothetical protein